MHVCTISAQKPTDQRRPAKTTADRAMAADSDRSPGAECVEGPDAADMPRGQIQSILAQFLVHRRLVGEEDAKKWVRCDGWDEGH